MNEKYKFNNQERIKDGISLLSKNIHSMYRHEDCLKRTICFLTIVTYKHKCKQFFHQKNNAKCCSNFMYFMQQKHTFTTMESAVLLLSTNGWCVFSEVLLCLKIINYWWRNENLDKSVKKSCGCSFWCGAQLLRPFQCITTLWKRLHCQALSKNFQIFSGTHQIQCKWT